METLARFIDFGASMTDEEWEKEENDWALVTEARSYATQAQGAAKDASDAALRADNSDRLIDDARLKINNYYADAVNTAGDPGSDRKAMHRNGAKNIKATLAQAEAAYAEAKAAKATAATKRQEASMALSNAEGIAARLSATGGDRGDREDEWQTAKRKLRLDWAHDAVRQARIAQEGAKTAEAKAARAALRSGSMLESVKSDARNDLGFLE